VVRRDDLGVIHKPKVSTALPEATQAKEAAWKSQFDEDDTQPEIPRTIEDVKGCGCCKKP
jgi:hypothetical protein